MVENFEGCDKILFIVEGKKTEPAYIKMIYEHFYPNQYIHINRTEESCDIQNPDYKTILDINWIEDANIKSLVEDIKNDEYGDGISPVNYFKDKNDVDTYSEAFIIIDADLKDKSSSGLNELDKINLLKELYNIVCESDENIELLISSLMLESIVDYDEEYEYKKGESYKKEINKRYYSGAHGHFQNNIKELLLMNVRKYQTDQIKYEDHSMYPLRKFDIKENIIKVRSPLFHLIANKEKLYGETNLFIEYLERVNNISTDN